MAIKVRDNHFGFDSWINENYSKPVLKPAKIDTFCDENSDIWIRVECDGVIKWKTVTSQTELSKDYYKEDFDKLEHYYNQFLREQKLNRILK